MPASDILQEKQTHIVYAHVIHQMSSVAANHYHMLSKADWKHDEFVRAMALAGDAFHSSQIKVYWSALDKYKSRNSADTGPEVDYCTDYCTVELEVKMDIS